MTQLQSSNIGDDGPPIFDRNLSSIARHRAPAVGHYVKEMSHWRFTQTLLVVRRWLAEAASHDHAIAFAGQAVTNRTKDLKAFLTSIKYVGGDRIRKFIDIIRVSGCDLCCAGSIRRCSRDWSSLGV